jgi:hypothetical protein
MLERANRLGIWSLASAASICAVVLLLILANRAKLEWPLDALLIVSPYAALIIASTVAIRSRYYSGWVLACTVCAAVTNPAVYLLFSLIQGGRLDEVSAWVPLIGTAIAWTELGAALVLALVAGVTVSYLRFTRQLRDQPGEHPRAWVRRRHLGFQLQLAACVLAPVLIFAALPLGIFAWLAIALVGLIMFGIGRDLCRDRTAG